MREWWPPEDEEAKRRERNARSVALASIGSTSTSTGAADKLGDMWDGPRVATVARVPAALPRARLRLKWIHVTTLRRVSGYSGLRGTKYRLPCFPLGHTQHSAHTSYRYVFNYPDSSLCWG